MTVTGPARRRGRRIPPAVLLELMERLRDDRELGRTTRVRLGPGPLASVVQGMWRCLLREDREQEGQHDNTCRDEGQ